MPPRSGYTPGGPVLEFLTDPRLPHDLAALRDLLSLHGPVPLHDPDEAELARLEELREALLALADVLASGRLPRQAELADLNRFLAAAPVRVQVAAGERGFELESTPESAGWETVVRDLAGRFAELLVDGEPLRLRRCANPACRRLFYDASRSGTRRWHDDRCGSLVRVRRFRAAR